MRAIFHLLLFIAVTISSASASAQEKAFYDENIAYSADQYEKILMSNWKAGSHNARRWISIGQAALQAGDTAKASTAFASAAKQNNNSAAAWLGLARTYLAMQPLKSGDSYRFLETATSAAYLGYTRTTIRAQEADALAILANALAKRQYWRPALNAYKASLDLRETPNIRATYEQLKAEQGFRLIDYKIDSDAKNPRLCAQFSEKLATERVNFAKFVRVNGKDPASVTKEDYQLCVGGLSHGKRYEVTIRQGLPSAVGEDTSKSVQLTIYVRDRSPTVRFTGQGYVLPKTGQNGIPLISVNTKSVHLKIYAIGDRALAGSVLDGNFSEQISGYKASQIADRKGKQVWQGDMPVSQVLNEEVTTAIPVSEALPKLEAGLYIIVAQPESKKKNSWSPQATQWFVVSDLGLSAFSGPGGVHGFARSLATAKPLKNIELRLVARNNEILGRAKTNAQGHVHFASGLTKGEGGEAPALLVAEQKGTDYAFLDLTRASFDLTDRGVGGRETPGPLDAFIYTERGVYRPSEKVYVTALLRDKKANSIPNLPLTLIYERPDNVEHERITLNDQGFGGRSATLRLQDTAMTGTWRAKLYADPKEAPIGEATFLVEDYVPERLQLKLSNDQKPLGTGETAKVTINGRYLYGAPASNLGLEGEITIAPDKDGIAGYDGYKFGIPSETLTPIRRPLFGLPSTDANGKATIKAAIPPLPQTSQALKASVQLRLQEPGGRVVSETQDIKIKPAAPLIGIKPLFKNGHTGEGETASFNIIALSTDLAPTHLQGMKWELLRINQNFQWYSRNGAWGYEPITFTSRVANGNVDLSNGTPFTVKSAVENGRYRLIVTSKDPAGPAAQYEFTAGWYASAAADTPDILEVALDKESYELGETATLTLSPRMGGKAVIAVLTDKLVTTKTVDVTPGNNQVSLEVTENWQPGAYITATVYRPMDHTAERMPGRAIGIKWVSVNKTNQRLTVKLDLREKTRPQQPLSIPVKIDGLKAGSNARIVVSAVDVGILNLTNYDAPKPANWYYGQRQLSMEIRDLYGRLIDGMTAAKGRIRSGGDGGGLQLNARPPAQEPVAFYSGIVNVAADGTATVNFDIPQFDGTLRIMAIAWNDTQLGEAEKEITVRDPVVLTATTPRFLISGDKSVIHMSLDNVEGPAGDYTIDIALEGPLSAKTQKTARTVSLKSKERKSLSMPFLANTIGDGSIDVALSGPNGYEAHRNYTLQVNPAAPDVKRRFVSNLTAGGGKLAISKDAYSGLIPASVKIAVHVGPGAALDVPGLLLALDRYPHGCAEQITSRALPLLYMSAIAQKAGVAGDEGAKNRVQSAIDRLSELQNYEGAFGLWRPAGQDLWLTAYVTDFLTRAKETGYQVKPEMLTRALDKLGNFLNYAPDFKSGGEDVAYALYVLARNSKANIGDLRYYADTKLRAFASAFARAQLGAALALYGDKTRSARAFRSAMEAVELTAETANFRKDYGTLLRDGAATLTLASETGMETQKIPNLTNVLQTMRSNKAQTTTQENAWLLLAANALLDDQKPVKLAVNGQIQSTAVQKVLTMEDFAAGDFAVVNEGARKLSAAVSVHGASLTPEPAAAKGFKLTRSYHTLEGKPVDLAKIKQNDRVVVLLKVTEDEAKRGRLILTDRLAAGFEIENPKLVDSTNVKSLSWIAGATTSTNHTAFRDDKFVAAFDLGNTGQKAKPASKTLAYIVRAVVPGTYVLPAANVEDMYRPDRYAQTAGGSVIIRK